jgi:16S rRNA (guanine966-N2)-methyltransferase
VRVVGGVSRGRRLAAPVAHGVRPTSDRVRESIFNILANLVDLNGLQVADLFAGTGALGIEALSRGAGSVTFVENDAAAFASISANLASTGLEGPKAVLKRRDALDFVRSPDATFDLVLCDPPYSFERWDELMRVLRAHIAVFESGSPIEVDDRWMVLRSRRYGGTLVTVVRAGEESQGESQGESQ